MSLLESETSRVNGNNIIGRLVCGLIGLDLMTKSDPTAMEYIDSCLSVCQEFDEVGEDTSKLMAIFAFERPARFNNVSKKFIELSDVLLIIKNNPTNIETKEGKEKIKEILSDVTELIRNRELIG